MGALIRANILFALLVSRGLFQTSRFGIKKALFFSKPTTVSIFSGAVRFYTAFFMDPSFDTVFFFFFWRHVRFFIESPLFIICTNSTPLLWCHIGAFYANWKIYFRHIN